MSKLSPNMQRVIDLMRDGWELGASIHHLGRRRIWLQKGGISKGGESEGVSAHTFEALLNRGVILRNGTGSVAMLYKLSEPLKK